MRTGRSDLEVRRLLHGHVDVDLETGVVIDGRQHRGLGDAVTGANGNVADDAGGGGRHAVERQLRLLLPDLVLDRFQLRLGGFLKRHRLLVFLLAHRADAEQVLRAGRLLPGERRIGFASGAHGLERRHRGLL